MRVDPVNIFFTAAGAVVGGSIAHSGTAYWRESDLEVVLEITCGALIGAIVGRAVATLVNRSEDDRDRRRLKEMERETENYS